MTAQTIIDVDVRDQAFDKMKAKFDQFQAAVKKQPAAWGAVHAEAMETAKAIAFAEGASQGLTRNTENAVKGQKAFVREAISGRKVFRDLADDTLKMSDNIKSATKSMLSWIGIGGVFSGLLGGGSLFGLAGLAHSTSAGSKAAQGLGLSVGEQRSFRLNYGRYVEPDSFLQKIADAKNDYTKLQWFRSVGIQGDVSKMDTQALAMAYYKAARSQYANSDKSQQFVQSRGIDNFMSMDDLRRSQSFSDKDVDDSERDTRRDNKTLDLDPSVEDKWRRLGTALDRAESKITAVLVNGLAPLAGPVGALADRFSDLLATLLKSPVIKEWMQDLADGLEVTNKWLGSAEFKSDVESFAKHIGLMAKALVSVVKWIADKLGWITTQNSNNEVVPGDDPKTKGTRAYYELHPDEAPLTFSDEQRKARGMRAFGTDQNGRIPGEPGYQNLDRQKDFDQIQEWKKGARYALPAAAKGFQDSFSKKYNLPDGFSDKIFGQEGGLNPDGSPRISSAGAIGAGQLMPGTARGLGVNPYDVEQNVEGSTRYMRQMLNMFGGDQEKAAAAYNWGPGNVRAAIAKAERSGADWRSFLPAETAKYIQAFKGAPIVPVTADPGKSPWAPSNGNAPAAVPEYQKKFDDMMANIRKGKGWGSDPRSDNTPPPEATPEEPATREQIMRATRSGRKDQDYETPPPAQRVEGEGLKLSDSRNTGTSVHIYNNTGGNAQVIAGSLAA